MLQITGSAMAALDLRADEIWSLLAGLLHLGNVKSVAGPRTRLRHRLLACFLIYIRRSVFNQKERV